MTIISINGVPATDALAFMGEVRRVVGRDYDRVENALETQAHLDEVCPHDEWEVFAFAEQMLLSWDDEEARWLRRPKFISKRKEVK
jgi:hypothetical protein